MSFTCAACCRKIIQDDLDAVGHYQISIGGHAAQDVCRLCAKDQAFAAMLAGDTVTLRPASQKPAKR